MSRYVIPLPDLVIANAGTESNDLLAGIDFGDAVSITIHAPATLPEATKVQVSDTETSPTWRDLRRNGADVSIGAGDSITIENLSFKALQLLAATTAAIRTFAASKVIETR